MYILLQHEGDGGSAGGQDGLDRVVEAVFQVHFNILEDGDAVLADDYSIACLLWLDCYLLLILLVFFNLGELDVLYFPVLLFLLMFTTITQLGIPQSFALSWLLTRSGVAE